MAKPAHEPTDLTVEKQNKPWQFQPGQSGNVKGRPIGAKARFSQDFIADVHEAWLAHGADALRICAVTEPGRFLQVCASLMPRDVAVAIDVDICLQKAVNAVEAFRLLKSLNDTELKKVKQQAADVIEG